MSKLLQAFHSRAVWTMIIMLVINLLPQLNVDQSLKDLINGILVIVAGYFHVNVSQIYTPANVTPPASGESYTAIQP